MPGWGVWGGGQKGRCLGGDGRIGGGKGRTGKDRWG